MLRTILALSLLLFSCTKPASATSGAASPPLQGRIVVLGDVHGDTDRARDALKLAQLIDENDNWIGKDTILVQLGDLTDRGDDSRGSIALFRKLQQDAPKSGGQVVVLIGNHEAMNMQGDWRYVSSGDIAIYGGKEARKAAYQDTGEDGKYIKTLPSVVKLGDTVFVHGGILPTWANKGIDTINEEIHATLQPGKMTTDPNHPLWYRGFVQGNAQQECALLDESLKALGARRMVVGHTRTDGGQIRVRCSGALIAADVSLSRYYPDGQVALVEIIDGDAKAIYLQKVEDLLDPK
jgi:hypothetical protein